MPKWEIFNDNVLVYGRRTPDERKLEGMVEIAEYLNQADKDLSNWRELGIRRGFAPEIVEGRFADLELQCSALSMALAEETQVLRETQAAFGEMIDALLSALGTTRYEYLIERTPLDALNALITQRDAAMEALRLYQEMERAVSDDSGDIGQIVTIQRLSERAREAREKVLKGAKDESIGGSDGNDCGVGGGVLTETRAKSLGDLANTSR